MIEGTRKLYNEAFDSIGVSPNVVFEIDSPSAILDLVKQKEGYAIFNVRNGSSTGQRKRGY